MYAAVRSSKSDTESFTRQGSLRRVIPGDHSNKGSFTEKQNEDFAKVFKICKQEYTIFAEYKMIRSEEVPGVYAIPSRESGLVWFGVIFVRTGPYEDGIFRFNLELDENFPSSQHPKVIIQSEMFHPAVHKDTNELNILKAFPTWNRNEQHVWQVLKFIQWIFQNMKASIAHGINEEAVDLLKSNRDAFNEKAKEIVKLSKEHLYDDPPTDDMHYIIFEDNDLVNHDKIKRTMLNYGEEEKSKGYSWVLPGTFKPLGRPSSPQSESES